MGTFNLPEPGRVSPVGRCLPLRLLRAGRVFPDGTAELGYAPAAPAVSHRP
jgi:hypothetical protein